MDFWFVCNSCGKKTEFHIKGNKCTCGGTLMVEYDLERASRTFTKENLKNRDTTMWRYKELLPIEKMENVVSLGEGWTPLVRLKQAEEKYPVKKLWVKREEQNPTGSFKSRGFSAAVSIANEYGINKVAVNSNGNAASALAAYASYAGMDSHVFVPKDCPGLIVEECIQYGAETYLVDGLIHNAGKIIEDGKEDQGWYNVGTLKEPGRAEGKKTMGLELAEQFNWKLPDVIVYPTGGGSGVIGIWNALNQLKELGFLESELPRIVSVQEAGCTPVVDAIESESDFRSQLDNVISKPTGMRVPNPPDGELIVSILRASNGTAVSVSKDEIAEAQAAMGKQGISSSPEGAATWAGFVRLIDKGWIGEKDEVVLFNTSHAMKYLPFNETNAPVIKTYEDYVNHKVNV
ncbi:threonine synthase [Thalassobacillus devorans]|uniref:Threonine synthase n=1 Tax=Thalassobacillus devorans TaxID=279813 RepID=A0ABQ1NVH8_9BACI|nr:threonine synthase [Thalassobacillus devorans]NIK28740.1 threonine synthase [Thalassobacillus devorans]GGC83928.1 threonine synthase [Thalassobacillus devorans]